jgi:hypothetical protein
MAVLRHLGTATVKPTLSAGSAFWSGIAGGCEHFGSPSSNQIMAI